MGRSRYKENSRHNQCNYTELKRNKDKEKAKKAKAQRRENEVKDYEYFTKFGTYRSGDNYRSLKEEALYKYFKFV